MPFAFSPGQEFRAPRGRVWWGGMVFAGGGHRACGRNVFRILRVTAGKENGQTREQNREPGRHGRTTKFGHDEANFAGSDGKAKCPGGEIEYRKRNAVSPARRPAV